MATVAERQPTSERVRTAERRRRRRRSARRRQLVALAFMSPWIIGILVFTLYPIMASLYYSFTHYDLLSTPYWIGAKRTWPNLRLLPAADFINRQPLTPWIPLMLRLLTNCDISMGSTTLL